MCKNEGEALYNLIKEFIVERKVKDQSLFQIVIMYCEEHELEIEEVGFKLKKYKVFREALEADLVFHNEAVFKTAEKKTDVSEWIGI